MMQVENPMTRPIVEKSSHWDIDACGDEILYGDTIYEFPDGEIVLEENIRQYLTENLGATRKIAE
ncbi:YqaI family protein [Parageobacillus thermoglucosidasius]|uniref:YqaI family protein n=1 Tax=Parageobacillus thermoglucosidasius TaxID=1426 RepID=UPI003B66C3F1